MRGKKKKMCKSMTERRRRQRTNLGFRFAFGGHELHLVPLLLRSRLVHVEQELHLLLGLLGLPGGARRRDDHPISAVS